MSDSGAEGVPKKTPHPVQNPDPVQGIAIVGPTASGKTALSLAVAEALGGEIISMDSRQVYRGMEIGTAKVSGDERSRVPHHGLDLVEPSEAYSAGRFGRDARTWIQEIKGRGRIPVLVGGTGFFLKALMDPVFEEPTLAPDRRIRFRAWAMKQSIERLFAWVKVLDPSRAQVARAGGPQRLIRTLEVAVLSGRPLSWWHAHAPATAPPVRLGIVRLQVSRPVLAQRIEARVDQMLQGGLLDEVDRLCREGAEPSDPGMTGVGYRACVRYRQGVGTLQDVREDMLKETRQYARRQETWFRHQLPPEALSLDALVPLEVQVGLVLEHAATAWGIGLGAEGVGNQS